MVSTLAPCHSYMGSFGEDWGCVGSTPQTPLSLPWGEARALRFFQVLGWLEYVFKGETHCPERAKVELEIEGGGWGQGCFIGIISCSILFGLLPYAYIILIEIEFTTLKASLVSGNITEVQSPDEDRSWWFWEHCSLQGFGIEESAGILSPFLPYFREENTGSTVWVIGCLGLQN